MNIFFTFCFDIGKINRQVLIKSAKGLVNSLNFFNNNYKLYIYTNVDELFNCINNENIVIIKYSLNSIAKIYNNMWFDLSFHKLHIANELCNATTSPIWIDLDTIVCKNVDHLVNYPSFFVMQGSNDLRPFHITNGLSVPHNIYIQGNIWKMNQCLLDKLMAILKGIPTRIEYDSQGLFNYAYHFEGLQSEMLIMGKDIDVNTINGLNITEDNTELLKHPEINLLKNKLIMQNNLIINTETNKTVQFFSFTFDALQRFILNNSFSQFTDEGVRNFFISCGY
jgi:hypothetical protein